VPKVGLWIRIELGGRFRVDVKYVMTKPGGDAKDTGTFFEETHNDIGDISPQTQSFALAKSQKTMRLSKYTPRNYGI